MLFTVSQELLEIVPEIKIGIVRGRIESEADAVLDKIQNIQRNSLLNLKNSGLTTTTLSQHSHIESWRETYRKFGVKAKKYRPTHEALARRALKGGGFPEINPIVDIYLANQIDHLLPHGGYDVMALTGDLLLEITQQPERFEPLGGGEEHTNVGEVVYRDDARVLSRRWNYRDCEATKITDQTTQFLLMIEGADDRISPRAVEAAAADLAHKYQEVYDGEFDSGLVVLQPNASQVEV